MKKKINWMVLPLVLLILGLAACQRPASRVQTEEVTPTTAEGAFPVPENTDVMGQLESFATQTAIALQGGGEVPATPAAPGAETPVQETPAEGAPTEAAPAGDTPAAEDTPAETGAAATPEATEPPQPAAPTETLIPVPTATPGIPSTYRLRSGEFPFCIARRFNVDPGELLAANNMGINSRPAAGTTLNIPQTGNPFPGNRSLRDHPTTYTVQQGDSIFSIACLFGDVDPESIRIANNLGGNADLDPGQSIRIP